MRKPDSRPPHATPPTPPFLTRRRFVQALGAAGAMFGSGARLQAASGTLPAPDVLRGTEFDLVIEETSLNLTGRTRRATTINGSFPAPTLVWREGDTVTLRVHNRLREDTSIHWHGIILPYEMDGVPGLSFAGIAPGTTFTYSFTVQQHGTYWYHSHTGDQKVTGMYGALIIEPRDGEHLQAERDYIVQLSDWSDTDMLRVFRRLKQQSDVYNQNKPTIGDFLRDVRSTGLDEALTRRAMWQQMRMNPTDLADVSGAVLSFLLNGRTPEQPWTGLFAAGERVRLRFINAAGNSIYDVRIPGVPMTLVQADGIDVQPVQIDEFRFGPGETYDVIVQPDTEACALFAQTIERSGFACGFLATAEGLRAPVPEPDPVQWLEMSDMMGSMDHSAHVPAAVDHSSHGAAAPIDHSAHQMPASALAVPSQQVRHASSEFGPGVDMRVDMPRTTLDDPGVGLRGNGRRVLTPLDVRALHGPWDTRAPEREIELHLTGNMERYTWSIDGLAFNDSTPVHMRAGERIRVILHNDTMMTHPMHLHGMWSDLETPEGEFLTRRHTMLIHPAQRLSFLTTPEELGRWAWHCHIMFHMDAGMFREVVVTA
jgi:CopA family copper-resistance protein